MQVVQQFRRAMRRQRFEEAEALLPELPKPVPVEVGESVGLLHVMHARWQEAAEALGQLSRLSEDMQALCRYAKNLATLERHHPDLFALVCSLPDSDRYPIVPDPAGGQTIADNVTKRFVLRSPHAELLKQTEAEIAKHTVNKQQMFTPMLMGLGDGRLVGDVVLRPSPFALGVTICWHVVEPDAQLFKACLFLNDWAGEDGLLAAANVVWAIGDDWANMWEQKLREAPSLPMPKLLMNIGVGLEACQKPVADTVDRINAETTEALARVTAMYANKTDAELAEALAGKAGRPPRILAITSRFTNVVQHSARDAMAGFEALGCDTELVIQPDDHHHLTNRLVLEAVERFQPDLFWSINYLRKHYAKSLPPKIPAMTWLQDEISELYHEEASQWIDGRQFVACNSPNLFVERYGYPLKQMVALDKLTRVPPAPLKPVAKKPVVVFVSNAARTPERLIDDMMQEQAGGGGMAGKVMQRVAERLVAHYEAGGSVSLVSELVPWADEAAQRLGKRYKAGFLQLIAMTVFTRVNNTLYRQEALRWAVEACKTLNLELHLYGQDWDKNPEFAAFNRGYANYGDDLIQITREAMFNLQVVPFNCTHQRLLDGWAAGGFYLIREHPTDVLNVTWNRLFDQLPADVNDWDAWLQRADPTLKAALLAGKADRDRILLDAEGDVVAQARKRLEEGYIWGAGLPPRLPDVWFNDAQSLTQRMQQHLTQPGVAAAILAEQQAYLHDKGFTYQAGMQLLLNKAVKELSTAC